jgi:hypothetical protein
MKVGTRTRRVSAAAGAAALLVGMTGAVTGASAAAATSSLLSGKAVDQLGHINQAMTISVEAWPSGAVLDSIAEGDTVPVVTLQTTHTNALGYYDLDPDLTALPADYLEPSGAVNLDVMIADASSGGSESYSFSAAEPGTDAVDNPLVATADRPQTVSFSLASNSVSAGLGSETAATNTTANDVDAADADTGGVVSPDTPYPTPGGGTTCDPWKKSSPYNGRRENFMNLWTAGAADVHEEVGSSHTVGVGVAVTGGGWTVSGSTETEAHSGAGGDRSYGHNYLLANAVNMQHLTAYCGKYVQNSGGGWTLKRWYKHRQVVSSMNALLLDDPHSIGDHNWPTGNGACRHYTGGTFTKTSGSNSTIAVGVDGPFINVNARAAYTKDTAVVWHPPASGAYLCGSNTKGWASAPYAGEDKNPQYSGAATTREGD